MPEDRKMSDREMLMLVYGAMQAWKQAPSDLLQQLKNHLFPRDDDEE